MWIICASVHKALEGGLNMGILRRSEHMIYCVRGDGVINRREKRVADDTSYAGYSSSGYTFIIHVIPLHP